MSNRKQKKVMKRKHYLYLFLTGIKHKLVVRARSYVKKMVNKCVAPKCKYNYDSERQKRKDQNEGEKTGIFDILNGF